MALVLVATPGASNANSYTTVAEGNAYHEGHLYASKWNSVDDIAKAQGLVWATRLIDERFEWDGSKASSTQALRWPRFGMVDADGYGLDSNVIPQALKNASAELARGLLTSDLTTTGSGSGALSGIKVGPIELTYASAVEQAGDTIPDSVYFMLRHWGYVRKRGSGGIPLFRV